MSLRLPAVFCWGPEVLCHTVIYYRMEIEGWYARRLRRAHADQLSQKSKRLVWSWSAIAPLRPSWDGDNWRRGDAPKLLLSHYAGTT